MYRYAGVNVLPGRGFRYVDTVVVDIVDSTGLPQGAADQPGLKQNANINTLHNITCLFIVFIKKG
jgi:hypothetical protein